MTKHFKFDPVATTDYIRSDDGAIMVEAEQGYFVQKPGTSVALPQIIKPPRAKPLSKPKRKRQRSFLLMSRHNIRSGITSAFRDQANPDIQTCYRNGAEKHFRFPAKIFIAPGCTGTDARFLACTPRSQFRERLRVRLAYRHN